MHDDAWRPVVIVGGGLAGLAAAAYLARAGREVLLCERSNEPGGRARTQEREGFLVNQGPHALYRGGAGAAVLRELGVAWQGKVPRTAGYAIRDGAPHRFPTGSRTIATTDLLSAGGKAAVVRFLATLPRLDPAPLHTVAMADWLRGAIRHVDARQFIEGLVRVSTYAADLERLSAGAALAQVRLALLSNVAYLDGGWRTLVAGLQRAAETAGATISAGSRVVSVERDTPTGAVRGVRLADGTAVEAAAVLIAAEPRVARELVERGDETALRDWDEAALPVRAACLDLGLRALPDPRTTFALGIDRPLYFSVHSAAARLAPGDGALIHVAKYLRADDVAEPQATRRELEALAEIVQPGWRGQLVTERFLPDMVVSHALVTAAGGGLQGRPGPTVPGVPGLYVAGDWVGATGMLADAALASAKEAAGMILTTRPLKSELALIGR